jgi:hypothetical protein
MRRTTIVLWAVASLLPSLVFLSLAGAMTEQTGTTGSAAEVGVPVPSTASDQETTLKHRDPSNAHKPDADAQVTLGGAQTFMEGNISRMEGPYYFIKKEDSGEETRLIVNRDTNLDCAAAPMPDRGVPAMTSERLTAKEEAPRASDKQLAQGQRADETARGSGFRIGDCAFQVGDRIKAEVDDNGVVTTLKYTAASPPTSPRSTGLSAGTGELALPGKQDRPAQLDLAGGEGYPPKEYAAVPLRAGPLEPAGDSAILQRPIFNLHGEQVGMLDNLFIDRATGRIEYAVILVEHTEHHLHPLPWAAIQSKADGKGDNKLIVDTEKYKIHPDVMLTDVEDLSPNIQQIVKDMKILREREAQVAKKRHTEKQATVGAHGEDTVGGPGPSGFLALPSGDAPGYEREKDHS